MQPCAHPFEYAWAAWTFHWKWALTRKRAPEPFSRSSHRRDAILQDGECVVRKDDLAAQGKRDTLDGQGVQPEKVVVAPGSESTLSGSLQNSAANHDRRSPDRTAAGQQDTLASASSFNNAVYQPAGAVASGSGALQGLPPAQKPGPPPMSLVPPLQRLAPGSVMHSEPSQLQPPNSGAGSERSNQDVSVQLQPHPQPRSERAERHAALHAVFLEFAQFGTRASVKTMDIFRFMKLCRECALLSKPSDASSVDLIFYKVRSEVAKLSAVVLCFSLNSLRRSVHCSIAGLVSPTLDNDGCRSMHYTSSALSLRTCHCAMTLPILLT